MPSQLQLLVIDAYDEHGREALASAGGTLAGCLYRCVLKTLEPEAQIDVWEISCSSREALAHERLSEYDGIIWTGSNLTIHRPHPLVHRHVELARAAFEMGVAQFGSCWAAHLAAVTTGGVCLPNPKGREFGIARRITLTAAGGIHPMFKGRPKSFSCFASHADEVVSLPTVSEHLAGNEFSAVQALATRHCRGNFWALQYHPEYDLHEVARLADLRRSELIAQGRFADNAEVESFIEDYETLHADPTREDLIKRRQVAPELLDPASRRLEIRNWLDDQVKRSSLSRS